MGENEDSNSGLLGAVNSNNTELPTDGVNPYLQNLQAKGGTNPVTINDYSTNTSPSEGALGLTDYYPNINRPTNIATYSGRTIGSVPIFGVGTYAPIGMMDARDAAIRKAALQKQMEEADFFKRYQRPITKDVQVQPKLTDAHNKFLFDSVKSFKNRYGKNWVAAISQDPEFNLKYSNLQDTAKAYDALVDHVAQLDLAEKDPNFVKSPKLRQQEYELHDKLNRIGNDPSDPKALGVVASYLNSKATYDMDAAANDYLKNIKPDITEEDLSTALSKGKRKGTEYLIEQQKKTAYNKERMEPGIRQVYEQKYYGDPNAPTYEEFRNNVHSKLNEHIENSIKNWDTYHPHVKDDGNDIYTDDDFNKENGSVNTTVMLSGVGNKPLDKITKNDVREGKLTTSGGITFKKPITAVMPIGKDVFFTNKGMVPSKEVGNKDVTLGEAKIYNVLDMPGNPLDGTPITDEQLSEGIISVKDGKKVKVGEYNIRKEPLVAGVYVSGTGNEKKEHPFLVPVKKVENALVKKRDANGNVTKGVPVDKLYSEADRQTEEIKSLQKRANAKPTGEEKNKLVKDIDNFFTPKNAPKKDPLGLFK